jgi:hypothetical protein
MEWEPYTPQTKRELLEVHAILFLRSPDRYLVFPDVPPERQQTLESTVGNLHRGIEHVFRRPWHQSRRQRLHKVADETYAEFKAGRVHEGRMLCREIEDLISKTWF